MVAHFPGCGLRREDAPSASFRFGTIGAFSRSGGARKVCQLMNGRRVAGVQGEDARERGRTCFANRRKLFDTLVKLTG